ncbi:MAG: beta-galactosidase [Armatimonadetes bacterium]|nr:beta-galactosidase [Armatimonadota bacterium]
MNRTCLIVAAVALLAACAGAQQDAPPIGKTRIPWYTGNMSVYPFMSYWGTFAGPASDLATPQRIAQLKRIGVFADCDYQSWCMVEQAPGNWDFSLYRGNADALHDAGLGYVPFSWVHFPPKWYLQRPEFVPYQCAEHGGKLLQLSPWAPNVWDIYREFYKRQRQAMGERVGWIRMSTPSDYGEIGYPAAMTSWLVPQKHAHAGYWCGDPYAREDFRAEMRRKFRGLAALNARWGTAFATWDAVAYPALEGSQGAAQARKSGSAQDRRRWLDFVDWYYGVWIRFTPRMATLLRSIYPTNPLVASVGYASEVTCFGNDYTAIPKMAARAGLALQTPGNVSYYGVKRVSTACHFYGCPFYTEPPGDVPPDAEVARFFCDISNGVQVYFEYPDNLDRARAKLVTYKEHMTGGRPRVDLALFHPTTEHRLNAGEGNFPLDVFLLGEQGRDRYDFDVVDESLIADGALRRYRALVYVAGRVVEARTLAKLEVWVRAGGILLTCSLGGVETVEGDRSAWRRLVGPEPAMASPGAQGWDWAAVRASCARRMGKGAVVSLPVAPSNRERLMEAVERLAHHAGDLVPGAASAPLIDGVADGVQSTLLPDRILYFNPTDKAITKRIRFRPADWARSRLRPDPMEQELTLPPHSIEAILLKAR